MSKTLDIRPHYADAQVTMWAHRGKPASGRLVVAFSGIGREEVPVQPYEFARTATGAGRDHALFISDTERSWLNAPGLIETIAREVEAFAAEVAARVICALGHSMGAFMALVMPGFTRIDRVVAFSPQFSVHPDVAGDDGRWMQWRSRITNWRIRDAGAHLNDTTSYYVFHGRHGREDPQRNRFGLRDNLMHMVLPRTDHNVPQRLREANLLEEVADAAFRDQRRRVRLALTPMNAVRRKAENAVFLPPSAALATAPEYRS